MNKKVIKVMIALVALFLSGLYILKIFFPEQFVMTIQNEQIIAIGNYIDGNIYLTIAFASFATLITYWLFICAVTRKWFLNWKELLCVLLVIGITQALYFYDADIANLINVFGMFIIPMFSKTEFRHFSIVYIIHYMAQLLSLKIRSLPLLLTNTNTNSLIALCLTAESYLWLLMFYFLFNYKKEV